MEERPQSLAECLSTIRDPRIDRTKRHKLIDILIIAICATICGAETLEEMELFGRSKEEWFKRMLELPNGQRDTITRYDRASSCTNKSERVSRELSWMGGIDLSGD
ncbi:MAG: hypothetical protein DMF61_27370 [Blastocatellia bacterium AA13]|nr:MAG: hypothetical protein DMF61_27370 [Blastocatellia bacterium AA13]